LTKDFIKRGRLSGGGGGGERRNNFLAGQNV